MSAPRCFGCGHYVRLGEGKVIKVSRVDGRVQYWCPACVADRIRIAKALKIGTTFAEYIRHPQVVV
jgi:hypothetical protein